MWNELSLGYSMQSGHQLLRRKIVEHYAKDIISEDDAVVVVPQGTLSHIAASRSISHLNIVEGNSIRLVGKKSNSFCLKGIYLSMLALLDRNDTCIVTSPSYQSLYAVAQAIGSKVVNWKVQHGNEGWFFDVNQLEHLFVSEDI